jgi:hypothetical protein
MLSTPMPMPRFLISFGADVFMVATAPIFALCRCQRERSSRQVTGKITPTARGRVYSYWRRGAWVLLCPAGRLVSLFLSAPNAPNSNFSQFRCAIHPSTRTEKSVPVGQQGMDRDKPESVTQIQHRQSATGQQLGTCAAFLSWRRRRAVDASPPPLCRVPETGRRHPGARRLQPPRGLAARLRPASPTYDNYIHVFWR